MGCTHAEKDMSVFYELHGGDTLYICNLSEVNSSLDINISDWLTDFKIVQLENTDSALVKSWRYYVTDSYIGISNEGQAPFKLFDHNGNLLCSIGRIGRGRGEYLANYSACIDESRNRICMSSNISNQLLVYDCSGNFIRSIQFNETLNKAVLKYGKDGTLHGSHIAFKDMSSFLCFSVDTVGNIEKYSPFTYILPKDEHGSFVGYNHEMWSYGNTSLFTYRCSAFDTLYAFHPETGKTLPRFTVKRPDNTFVFSVELPAYFVFGLTNNGQNETYLVDKHKLQAYKIQVFNDYTQLPVKNPSHVFCNGWYCEIFEPFSLIELIKEELDEPQCSEERRKRLLDLQMMIDENGNNILFLGKLKQ